MKSQDLLSILITFFVGVVAGAYIFLVGYAPTVAKFEVPNQSEAQSLVIESEVYGSCRNACPAFQLDGHSYRYLYYTSYDDPPVIKQGSIPFALRRELQKNLTLRALQAQSQPRTPALCGSYEDGIDVQYTITLDGLRYVLDTCGTNVDTNSPLWLSIKKIWDYVEVDSEESP